MGVCHSVCPRRGATKATDEGGVRKLLLLVLMGLMSCLAHAGDATAGQGIASACAGCHGADGNSTNPQWPKLAGQHETYLVIAIRAYQSGARTNPMMQPMVAGLSDQDIQDLAAYFASQEQK